MKKYTLGTLCYCMIVIGANLPSHAKVVSGCYEHVTEQKCLSETLIPEFKTRCAKMGYIYDRAEWSKTECGSKAFPGGCAYFCKT